MQPESDSDPNDYLLSAIYSAGRSIQIRKKNPKTIMQPKLYLNKSAVVLL